MFEILAQSKRVNSLLIYHEIGSSQVADNTDFPLQLGHLDGEEFEWLHLI